MSFIKKEDLIDAVKSCGKPYDRVSIYRVVELINNQLTYTITNKTDSDLKKEMQKMKDDFEMERKGWCLMLNIKERQIEKLKEIINNDTD
ncbi:MAG: hypothetical protein IKH82_03820 [Clostridiales bacterium]|nr:hypothetical protein [Clostridiales bacterium]